MLGPDFAPGATPVHAAIDIGTNSFHLVVARAMPDGGFDVLTTEKVMVRLGQGAGEMKRLTPEAIDRGIDALRTMVAVAESYNATVSATATSAVREALNRNEFLDRAWSETGVRVEVISGFEEARLIHLGVLQALPVFDRQLLLIDIGGGSTEFLVGAGAEVKAARSLKLGAIRLTDRFFADIDAEDIEAKKAARKWARKRTKRLAKCREHIRSALAATATEFNALGHEVAIGSSGTITAMAAMIAAGRGHEDAGDGTHGLNGFTFTAAELSALVDRIAETRPEDRPSIPGMDVKRVDIILAGAVLLDVIFESFEIETMTVSDYALREGLLFDRLSKHDLDSDYRLSDLRRTNVERLTAALDPDAEHAAAAARLAVRLFDETVEVHGLGAADRELLELGALVHNVGLFISHASHHKHAYYVVRHSEQLTGFSEWEREMLALIARYHRKGHPADKHPEFAALSAGDQQRVRVLAGLLRVAIGLDRAHQGVVSDVEAVMDADDRRLRITPHPVQATDQPSSLSLEVFAAQERSTLLAEALEVDVVVIDSTATGADPADPPQGP